VAEHAECAKEVAAAARFELMLEKRLGEAVHETKAAALLLEVAVQEAKRAGAWRGLARPVLKVAALIAIGGLLWWGLGLEGWKRVSSQPVVGRSIGKPEVNHEAKVPAVVTSRAAAQVAGPTEWTAESLRSWLDGYYLGGVDFKQVTLKEGLGRLQADMMTVNFLGAEVVGRLRVTVSANAAGRRVSLQTGAISFFKAVQTLAAQAGCEVEVGHWLLAVESKAQPFPQPTARHDLREVLAGRFDENGVAEVDRPDLMARVWADAVDQGFVEADEAGAGPVRLTQGQLDTLRLLADARAQMDQLPEQEYQVRLVPPGTYGQGRALDAEEVRQILAQPGSDQQGEVVTAKPGQRVDLREKRMGLEMTPVGQGWQVRLWAGNAQPQAAPQGGLNLVSGGLGVGDVAWDLNANAIVEAASVVVMAGQGAALDLSSAAVRGMSPSGDAALSGAVSGTLQLSSGYSVTNSASAGQVLLLPVDPPNLSPP